MSPDCDVVVVGGGVAGSATAIALSRLGCSVVLLERSNGAPPRFGEALTPDARPVLTSLGVWDRFLSGGHSPSFGIQSCWGQSEPYQQDFIRSPYGTGWNLDRARFDGMLFESARDAGARTFSPATIVSPELRCGTWHFEVGGAWGAFPLRAKFLVDATGRRAAMARAQGARSIVCDRLLAVAAQYGPVLPVRESHSTILIEAVENGWWYSVSTPEDKIAVAYLTDSDQLPRDGGRFRFWPRLIGEARHTFDRIRGRILLGRPSAISAHTSCMESASGENWLAVGDAAASLDPLSSHGIHKSLRSGIAAADAIRRHFNADENSLGEYTQNLQAEFTRYLIKRRWYYARERRWTRSPFWTRRAPVS